MKIIGITGSFDRTSIAKMLYKYFEFSKVNASLYCLEGFYCNGVTKERTDVNLLYSVQELQFNLEIDRVNNIEYAIVEIIPESLIHDLGVENMKCDLLVISDLNFDTMMNLELHQNAITALKKTVQNAKDVLSLSSNKYLDLHGRREYLTYGLDETNNFCIDEINDTLKSNVIKAGKRTHTFGLLYEYHKLNISCVISVLEFLDKFKSKRFKRFIRKNKIGGNYNTVYKSRNRIIVFYYGNRKLVDIVNSVVKIRNDFNYKLYCFVSSSADVVENSIEFRKAKHSYLVIDNVFDRELMIQNEAKLLSSGISNFQCSDKPKQHYDYAVGNLKDNEVLIVFGGKSHKKMIERLRSENGKL